MTEVALLGATGSIGRQTIDVCRQEAELHICAITGGQDWKALAAIARELRPRLVAIADESAYPRLRDELRDTGIRTEAGVEGLCAAAALPAADITVAAISGMAGLAPLLSAIRAGKTIALANKEALVCGGQLVLGLARQHGVELLPVDSEHSAIWQCLRGEEPGSVAQLILTASGGAFRQLSPEQLRQVTAADALRHPTWRMGPKITVDCATMANKGLEVIEAHWLFGVEYERIRVLIHPESVIHSLAAFRDGSVKAQLAVADMRLPIRYALLRQERTAWPQPLPDLAALGTLHFAEPDTERFPALAALRLAGEKGGGVPAYANGANEELNGAFRRGELAFTAIGGILKELATGAGPLPADSEAAIYAADRLGRDAALRAMEDMR